MPATRTVVFSGEDYASMDGPALAAAIDGKRKELFDMRLENRQGRQKATFKSNIVRNLKKEIVRIIPRICPYDQRLKIERRLASPKASY